MKIALVRGPHLNPWELQSYLPLIRRHELLAIGANWQFYQKPVMGHGVNFRRASLWGAALQRFHPKLPIVANRALSWTTGMSFGLYDLPECLRGCDLMHSVEIYSTMTFQCLEIKRKTGCKLVATVWENIPFAGELHPLRKKRKYEVLDEIDGALAVTETTRQILIKEGMRADRIAVIPMAVDFERFHPRPRSLALAQRLGVNPEDLVVLFVGRFVEEKGIRDLIEAIPHVLKQTQGKNVRFCFVGQGPLLKNLQQASSAFPGRLLIQPFVSYDEIPDLHNLADIFVLPSKPAPKWQEQFGYVLIESMACAKPILSTQSGSITDVVGDAGLLVPPGDPGQLSKALNQLILDAPRRQELGLKARQRATTLYDVENVGVLLERFYSRVMSGSSLS